MTSREKILDDIARIAGGAASILSDAGKQANQNVRSRVDEIALKLDLVPREDFDRLELMLQTAREEIDMLKARVDALEGAKKTPTKKTSAKKTKTTKSKAAKK